MKDIPDFRRKLRDCRKNLSAADPLVRRLVNDGYICIYVNPDLEQYTKYAAQNVTKEKESQEPKMAAAADPVYGTCVWKLWFENNFMFIHIILYNYAYA